LFVAYLNLSVSLKKMCKTLYATLLCACLTQAGARREAIQSHDQFWNVDVCPAAVTGGLERNTYKKQTEKCKCPKGSFVLGDNSACQTYSRYFNPEEMEGLGCACTSCSEIVANSNIRDKARKHESDKCKCPKKHIVSGHDEECFSLEPNRYFDPIKLKGKNCQCLDEEQVKTITPAVAETKLSMAPTTSSTTTTEVSNNEEEPPLLPTLKTVEVVAPPSMEEEEEPLLPTVKVVAPPAMEEELED